MNHSSPILLKDIIDVEALMNVQKKLSSLLNFNVVTADPVGNTVGELVNFIPFCDLIRSSTEGARRCEKSGSILSEIAYNSRKPVVHDCHLGLKDCAAPIIVDNMFLGAVLGGQAFVEGEEYRRNNFDVETLSRELDLPADKLREAIAQIPVVPEDYIYNCLDFYGILSTYFAEIGIKHLIQKALFKESEAKLEFQNKARTAQLKTIEAQINPHFLFNTLNSIARMAMFEEAPNTEEMIYCLSDLMRYNLRSREEFPTIENELNSVQKYLFIQSVRYQDRMQYFVDVSPEVQGYRIPAMVLQPVVENAIVHGLEPKVTGGNIYISGRTQDDGIVLIVRDTGVGICQSVAETLLSDGCEGAEGLGLRNSHGRLRAYFGKDYGLSLVSKEGEGTTIEIKVPRFKCVSTSGR